jgi:cellobiose-specific phosphotransferase system component IIA
MKDSRNYFCMIVAVGALMLTPALMADAGQVSEDRILSVERLVDRSSAARQIMGSNNPAAMARHEEARSLFDKARTAFHAGDPSQADILLKQATQAMFDAARMVEKDSSLVEKEYRDYSARLDSLNALCDAYDRIRKEKGLGPAEDSELYSLVHRKKDQADALKQAGRVTEGRSVLDDAYVAAKVAIEHLRGGDTLVRSLDFASPEEEYRYEIDRNDTHRMLVDVLLTEKVTASESVGSMVNGFMQKARSLRSKAEQQADQGDYDSAIHTLEESTREIVRAIRSAGIYIPG